jgi:putative phosphoribosyl transferase
MTKRKAKAHFGNRSEAGRALARALTRYKGGDPLILALPRGGVVVAAEIALALDAPLDLILVRKLGVPLQPELAMGAVVDGATPYVVRNEDVLAQLGISEKELRKICERELGEIERRRALYLRDRPRADIEGRTVIVVDDGVATGASVRAALGAIRKQNPGRLVLAVPVAPAATIAALSGQADDIVCLHTLEPFYAISLYYKDFHQVSDAEVREILSEVRASQVLKREEAT